jgi:hypothetical protein
MHWLEFLSCLPAAEDYRSREGTSDLDFRLRTSDFRLRTSDFKHWFRASLI